MENPSRVRLTGPLKPYARGFAAELSRQGYTPVSAAVQLRLLAHVSRWLAGEGLDATGLAPEVVERFLAARRAAEYTNHRSGKALGPLLGHLRGLGATPPPAEAALTPVEALLERYRRFLATERGLAASTACGLSLIHI